MDNAQLEHILISEIKLNQLQARIFLLVTCDGKMSAHKIAEKMDISIESATKTAVDLVNLGAFIDFSGTEFEAMHPRFTAVNMYRKMCEREHIDFKRNKLVDNIGVFLERSYDAARTK